jgi:AcrR family transcriptional regulator
VKERIVKSALNLFWRFGIKSVTMDDIAKELGISKRTIYQHYADKEAILAMVINEQITSQKCEIDKLDEILENPIDQMIQATDQMRISLAQMNPALIYDLKKYYPESWALFQSYKNDVIINGIRKNLKEGIALGLYRPDIDIEVLSLLRIEEFDLAFDPTIFPPDKFHMMRVQMQFVHHFLRGILTDKGFQYYNTIKINQ